MLLVFEFEFVIAVVGCFLGSELWGGGADEEDDFLVFSDDEDGEVGHATTS